ncbi:helix-turn-helix transcriptional regulator [Mesorhizobium sp. M0520]|uniref:helix-turn-helix transcriptional regulator n=2 Tax=Mesorhizobium TaxID=68287 RepID=UPI00333B5148
MSELSTTARKVPIDSVEALREAVAGADFDIVQLAKGNLTGSLTHLNIGSFSMSIGRFSSAVRSRGVVSPDRLTLAMLLDGSNPRYSWSHDVIPGDIGVFPPRLDHESVYQGPASYATISMLPPDIAEVLVEENLPQDVFKVANRYRLPTQIRAEIRKRFLAIIAQVEPGTLELSPAAADFLRRSLKEVFAMGILQCMPPTPPVPVHHGAQLVNDVENHMESAGVRPVHISEICGAFQVSRRTLHRAFLETLGIGPIGYLRRKRLCSIQAILKRSDPEMTNVSDIAIEHGFFEHGRFSGYYKVLFGETPSETLRAGAGRFGPSVQPEHDLRLHG